MNTESQTNHPCPSLGLLDDAATSEAFPSVWNYCHLSRPVESPALKHQAAVCLGGKYGECPVFLNPRAMPLPKHIRVPRTIKQRSLFRNKLILALTALVVVLVLAWGILNREIFAAPGVGTATQISFAPASSTPTEISAPTMTTVPPSAPILTNTATAHVLSSAIAATYTRVYTPTLYPTATPTGTPSQLDVVIGTDYKFVIHKVVTGEDLDQYAAKYNTSVEAILAVNHGLTIPVWVDVLVVIPVGFTDYVKLPGFVVYEVKPEERGSSVEEMAKRLRVNPLDLRYYNGWTSDGDRPLVGDLLLVPRPRPLQ